MFNVAPDTSKYSSPYITNRKIQLSLIVRSDSVRQFNISPYTPPVKTLRIRGSSRLWEHLRLSLVRALRQVGDIESNFTAVGRPSSGLVGINGNTYPTGAIGVSPDPGSTTDRRRIYLSLLLCCSVSQCQLPCL